MVADFISTNYSWLCSPDGEKGAWVLFKAGTNRDGYFTNEEILGQVICAMDILKRYYPDDQHIFIYDNTHMHLKHSPDVLSAHCMV